MTQLTKLLSTTALLCGAANAAAADVTAADVWEAFKSQISLYGTLTATEVPSSGNLTITDLTLSNEIDGQQGVTTITGTIGFRELGDGTVAIDFPPAVDVTTTAAAASDLPPVSVDFSFAQQGMTVIASGTPDNINHDFNAPSMTYILSGVTVDGNSADIDVNLTMTDTAGTYVTSGSADRSIDADYTMGGLTIVGGFTEPATGEKMQFDVAMSDMKIASLSTVPAAFDPSRPELLFGSGFVMDVDIDFGATDYSTQVTTEGQTANITGKMANGAAGVGLNADGVRYQTASNDMEMQVTIPGLPFPPVQMNYNEANFDFAMPLAKSDVAQDFKLVSTLKGLTVSDFLWAMVDPAQQLPRSPATVVMDLSGKANWLVDIMNPEVAENLGDEVPGKLESLALNDLQVTIAGAELTGKGAFTFDNDDLQTFGGVPRPEGAIDLALSGGITLLDKLTAMQLVPQEQAMGIKMMSGLFAKPGAGPDTLTTKIEIDANGGVSANGQQLQ